MTQLPLVPPGTVLFDQPCDPVSGDMLDPRFGVVRVRVGSIGISFPGVPERDPRVGFVALYNPGFVRLQFGVDVCLSAEHLNAAGRLAARFLAAYKSYVFTHELYERATAFAGDFRGVLAQGAADLMRVTGVEPSAEIGEALLQQLGALLGAIDGSRRSLPKEQAATLQQLRELGVEVLAWGWSDAWPV